MWTRSLVSCVVVAVLSMATPALAHVAVDAAPAATPVPSPPTGAGALSAAAPAADGLWTLLAAVGIAAVAIARRRRAVALACVALFVVIAFEAGLHSVHHVGDDDDPSCVVASAAAQTGALTVESVTFERPLEVATPLAVGGGTSTPVRSSAPDLGRAPPAA